MKFSISTNWFNCESVQGGEDIVDRALSLGFGEIELGYNVTDAQIPGLESRLGEIVFGSVHAFAPVPISAPLGHPELYRMASLSEEERKLSRIYILRSMEFAAKMGASTLVLHAGRVSAKSFFGRDTLSARLRSGRKMIDVVKGEIDFLLPRLEALGVTLALENMPYIEGFPNLSELKNITDAFKGAPVKGWLDTGHYFLGVLKGFESVKLEECSGMFVGMHLNDVIDADDHLAPGEGKVDFNALKEVALEVDHLVFEPNRGLSDERVRNGKKYIEELWSI